MSYLSWAKQSSFMTIKLINKILFKSNQLLIKLIHWDIGKAI